MFGANFQTAIIIIKQNHNLENLSKNGETPNTQSSVTMPITVIIILWLKSHNSHAYRCSLFNLRVVAPKIWLSLWNCLHYNIFNCSRQHCTVCYIRLGNHGLFISGRILVLVLLTTELNNCIILWALLPPLLDAGGDVRFNVRSARILHAVITLSWLCCFDC